MSSLLSQLVNKECGISTSKIVDAANNPSLEWEEISAIASAENPRLMAFIEETENAISAHVDAAGDDAIATGIGMYDVAKDYVDPDFIPDLIAGVKNHHMKVRDSASKDRQIPMSYMALDVRKLLLLLETFLNAPDSNSGCSSVG